MNMRDTEKMCTLDPRSILLDSVMNNFLTRKMYFCLAGHNLFASQNTANGDYFLIAIDYCDFTVLCIFGTVILRLVHN